MANYDLHLHTHWSYDANAPVEFYFDLAEKNGTRAIAITDHHTMDGIQDVLVASKRHPSVRFIPGAELTCNTSIGAVDMVCLGLPVEPTPALETMFEEYRQWQRDFGDAVSRAMADAGFQYGREERLEILRRYRPEHIIQKQGITHVNWIIQLADFVRRGWTEAGKEWDFWKEVEKDHEFPTYPEASRVIPEVKRHGGLVFIAHPRHYFLRDDRKRMDQLREELDFDGIECAHSAFGPELTKIYREYCVENKLLSSAGSDVHSSPEFYHFNIDPECTFCQTCGEDLWLDEILERLA